METYSRKQITTTDVKKNQTLPKETGIFFLSSVITVLFDLLLSEIFWKYLIKHHELGL